MLTCRLFPDEPRDGSGCLQDGQRSCNSTPECTAFTWIHANITSSGVFYLKTGPIDLTSLLVDTREANASDFYYKIPPYMGELSTGVQHSERP